MSEQLKETPEQKQQRLAKKVIACDDARSQLYISQFITESQNDQIKVKIDKYIKSIFEPENKPKIIDAITFDKFIEYGLKYPGANIVNGEPWAFHYKGFPVTQENSELYLISSGALKFTPSDLLITREDGSIELLPGEQINVIKTEGDNEATKYPYWIIVNPLEISIDEDANEIDEDDESEETEADKEHAKYRADFLIHQIASRITGIWFSREEAETYLKNHAYNFSEYARVYCHTGHQSWQYKEAIDNGKKL